MDPSKVPSPPERGSMQRIIIASVIFSLMGLAQGSERGLRFVGKFHIPGSPEVVVIAEGDFEPRGVGSYALRVYGGTSKKFPLDDFVAGVVRPRNGTVEAVRFDDIDDDNRPEIVVIIRSAGSGGYLSADAFRYRAGSLEFAASISGLAKGADPIQALRDKFKVPAERKSSITPEMLQPSDLSFFEFQTLIRAASAALFDQGPIYKCMTLR